MEHFPVKPELNIENTRDRVKSLGNEANEIVDVKRLNKNQ